MATAMIPALVEARPEVSPSRQACRVRLGAGTRDLDSVVAMRGVPEDLFDVACDHLMVEDARSGELLATCRLQPFETAMRFRGFAASERLDSAVIPRELGTDTLEVGGLALVGDGRRDIAAAALWSGILSAARAAEARFLLALARDGERDELHVLERRGGVRIGPGLLALDLADPGAS